MPENPTDPEYLDKLRRAFGDGDPAAGAAAIDRQLADMMTAPRCETAKADPPPLAITTTRAARVAVTRQAEAIARGDAQPPAPTEDAGAMLARLGMDGRAWAREFLALFGHRLAEVDEGLMIGWFCNAIMAGYDRGHVAGALDARRALSVPLAPRGDGEPENTISRMVAALEAAAVEVGPAGAERLRACWLEVQDLRRGTAALLEQVRAERAAWIDRAAGLYYVIDRIDDYVEFLDPSEPATGIGRQIERSRVIVHTDYQGREVWGTPPAERTADGAPCWWPIVVAEAVPAPIAEEPRPTPPVERLSGRPTAVRYRMGEQDGELSAEVLRGRVRYEEDGTATVMVGEAAEAKIARAGDWIVRDAAGVLHILVDGFGQQRFTIRHPG